MSTVLCTGCGFYHALSATQETVSSPVALAVAAKKVRATWQTGIQTDTVTPAPVLKRLQMAYEGSVSPSTYQASDQDLIRAHAHKADLLYGEVQTAGVTRLLDADHLDAAAAQHVVDLGMGCGRLVLQVALQFPHLASVVGIELAGSRFQSAVIAANRLIEEDDDDSQRVTLIESHSTSHTMSMGPSGVTRVELHHGSLLGESLVGAALSKAHVIVCDVQIPHEERVSWLAFLTRHVCPGARIATYVCLEDVGRFNASTASIAQREPYEDDAVGSVVPVPGWQRLSINRTKSDRFATSWAPSKGHHFLLYQRV
jgi:hypothetical protein